MPTNYIKVKLKALFMRDDLVELYLKRYGEILNMSYVDEIKEEAKALQEGKVPEKSGKPGGNAAAAKAAGNQDSSTPVHKEGTAAKFIRTKLKAAFMRDDLVELYLQRYGEIINTAYIDQLKEEMKGVETGQLPVVDGKVCNDPIYEMEYQCPACYRNEVIAYHLRSKSQNVKETIFLVPQYSANSRYFADDYNLLQTTVCPQCLYASPDPKDWKRVSKFTGVFTESQLNVHTKLLADIRSQEAERKSKFPAAKDDPAYFLRPRNYDRALESLALSMMRAMLEKKYFLPAVNYKIGRYYLKIADIKKKKNEEYKNILMESEKWFSSAIQDSDSNNIGLEMECVYQVVALNFFLGNKDKGAAFFKIVKDVYQKKELAVKENQYDNELKAELHEVDKWKRRIEVLWDNRDEEEYWKNV